MDAKATKVLKCLTKLGGEQELFDISIAAKMDEDAVQKYLEALAGEGAAAVRDEGGKALWSATAAKPAKVTGKQKAVAANDDDEFDLESVAAAPAPAPPPVQMMPPPQQAAPMPMPAPAPAQMTPPPQQAAPRPPAPASAPAPMPMPAPAPAQMTPPPQQAAPRPPAPASAPAPMPMPAPAPAQMTPPPQQAAPRPPAPASAPPMPAPQQAAPAADLDDFEPKAAKAGAEKLDDADDGGQKAATLPVPVLVGAVGAFALLLVLIFATGGVGKGDMNKAIEAAKEEIKTEIQTVKSDAEAKITKLEEEKKALETKVGELEGEITKMKARPAAPAARQGRRR